MYDTCTNDNMLVIVDLGCAQVNYELATKDTVMLDVAFTDADSKHGRWLEEPQERGTGFAVLGVALWDWASRLVLQCCICGTADTRRNCLDDLLSVACSACRAWLLLLDNW